MIETKEKLNLVNKESVLRLDNHLHKTFGLLEELSDDLVELVKKLIEGNISGHFDIPQGVTKIKNGFKGCENLTSVTIPEGITTIDDSTFYGTGLKYVILPSTITSIDPYAFQVKAYVDFEYIICKATTPPTLNGGGWFPPQGIDEWVEEYFIYVPDESVNAYKESYGWKQFADKIKPLSEFPTNRI